LIEKIGVLPILGFMFSSSDGKEHGFLETKNGIKISANIFLNWNISPQKT
jgi:hypothetical protein